MYYVYILLCDQKTFYVGMTDNLERRLLQHQRKESPYTKKFSEAVVVYKENFTNFVSAENRELQLKKWSIAKKKALISGNINLLRRLSRGS
ncbi:MAG: GIY-YIG nuclease family protein [Candidatus Sungbacteria bacterium]|nr:GIY-YIG nuclease family protein [Candidatus Sungbacteria bacterium]